MADENKVPDSPLPLVTATFTTEQLAQISAGLIALRKTWALHGLYGAVRTHDMNLVNLANKRCKEISATYDFIESLVSQEQGAALLGELVRELGKPNI